MNIREAILKAADCIESDPTLFSFGAIATPKCGTPGCALGWIGYFLGAPRGKSILRGIEMMFGQKYYDQDNLFYSRMDKFVGQKWRINSTLCVKGLRRYADKYHPAEPSKSLVKYRPGADIVRDIIKSGVAA